jgi:hypothetical protein
MTAVVRSLSWRMMREVLSRKRRTALSTTAKIDIAASTSRSVIPLSSCKLRCWIGLTGSDIATVIGTKRMQM